ncbi:MAG: 3'-5' exonuclease [Gammaproteobacteria bacterium]|nr:3'-5' exonuclease [Gammaproteobacteria bacterium]
MSWLARLFRPYVELPPGYADRVESWKNLSAISEKVPLDQARFLVVDVETSGLDVRKDRLLSIGAVAVEARRLRAGENFESILRREEVSERENILIHGIGPQVQAAGKPPEESLMKFLEFIGKIPLVAFHAGFDQAMLDRNLRETLGVRLPNAWIDLAHLAPALLPEAQLPRAGLDDWLSYFGLRAHARHRAVDDAMATGELFLILLQRALADGLDTVSSLHIVAQAHERKVLGNGMGGA